MFTGIVAEVGRVMAINDGSAGRTLRIEAPRTARRLRVGASVCVDGVCLTAVRAGRTGFSVQVVPETARRSTLGTMRCHGRVNLERPLPAGGEVGGHFVQGHVDSRSRVEALSRAGGEVTLTIRLPASLRGLVVNKGSIAVNGVSLTVASTTSRSFSVALIPHTLARTNLGDLRSGDRVNLEADILGKYIHALSGRAATASMTRMTRRSR